MTNFRYDQETGQYDEECLVCRRDRLARAARARHGKYEHSPERMVDMDRHMTLDMAETRRLRAQAMTRIKKREEANKENR